MTDEKCHSCPLSFFSFIQSINFLGNCTWKRKSNFTLMTKLLFELTNFCFDDDFIYFHAAVWRINSVKSWLDYLNVFPRNHSIIFTVKEMKTASVIILLKNQVNNFLYFIDENNFFGDNISSGRCFFELISLDSNSFHFDELFFLVDF